MTSQLQMVLILLGLLQVKHLFADFFFQTQRMLGNRGCYLHFGRLQHAGLHGGLSWIALLVMRVPMGVALVICLVETLVHFHIDWAKGRHAAATGQGPEQAAFWRAFGVDQLMHQLTYVVMLWAVVVWA